VSIRSRVEGIGADTRRVREGRVGKRVDSGREQERGKEVVSDRVNRVGVGCRERSTAGFARASRHSQPVLTSKERSAQAHAAASRLVSVS
jgi:hypothetical protein